MSPGRAIQGGPCLPVVLLCCGGLAPSAGAAIDLSGLYVSRVEVLGAPCQLTFAQVGTAITITGPCTFGGVYTFDLAGTVDPTTGAFSATGRLMGLCETPGSVVMTGTGDGEVFSGSGSCGTLGSPVSGTKCGNGLIDAAEDCEDGNQRDGDCCSARCTSESSGSVCVPDGNSCTRDVCDGAGSCTHLAAPAGEACDDDSNECTADVCDAASRCTHAPNTAPCDDADACSTGDVCTAGACVGSGIAPECVGSIDLTGDWSLSSASGAYVGPLGDPPPFRHFEQRGAVLRPSVPGRSVGIGGVNPATGAFWTHTPSSFGLEFPLCTETLVGTTVDGRSLTGTSRFDCPPYLSSGDVPVTGVRCDEGCHDSCVPPGVVCRLPDAGARLTVRARRGLVSGRPYARGVQRRRRPAAQTPGGGWPHAGGGLPDAIRRCRS